jgi:Arc/MetJ-type ribon-helix-helix transcriptional regulator
MARSSTPAPRVPADVAESAEALVRAGRFASVEDALRAAVKLLAEEAAEADTDATVWQQFRARGAQDPRDLTAAEALACLNSDDPEKQRVLTAHLNALRDDVLNGNVETRSFSKMLGDIDGELSVPPRR